jgi:hypothetical protein
LITTTQKGFTKQSAEKKMEWKIFGNSHMGAFLKSLVILVWRVVKSQSPQVVVPRHVERAQRARFGTKGHVHPAVASRCQYAIVKIRGILYH